LEATIKTLATRDELSGGSEEFSYFGKEMGENFTNLHRHMSEDTDMICMEIGEKQKNSIKWMFVFWIGQVAATVGAILLFLKK
jgi:hypothetical protein